MSKDSVDLARSLNASSGEQRILNYQAFYGGIWVNPSESPLVEQRWRDRRESWRANSTIFSPQTHYVAPLPRAEANDFVARNHYLASGTQGESLRVGLFSAQTPRDTLQEEGRPVDRLVGVAIFADLKEAVGKRWARGLYDRKAGLKPLQLSRLILKDTVAFNGETWFLGAALRLMRQGYRRSLAFHGRTPWLRTRYFALRDPRGRPGEDDVLLPDYEEARDLTEAVNASRSRKDRVRIETVKGGHRYSVLLSLSDPVPHVLPGCRVLMPGHIGRVYQAFNGSYRGRTRAGSELWTPDGRPLSGRTLSKIGTEQEGRAAALAYLERFSGVSRRRGEPLGSYRTRAKKTAVQEGRLLNISHPGKHVYLWNLLDTGPLPPPLEAAEVQRFYDRPAPQLRDVLEVLPPGQQHALRAIAPEQESLWYAAALARWMLGRQGQPNAKGWGWVHPLVAYYEADAPRSRSRRQARPMVEGVVEGLQAGTLTAPQARVSLTRINSMLDHYP